MKFGVLADLHLGHAGEGRWHNRLLFDHAESIARAAVAALNEQDLDAVFILGDITESGEEGQIALAKAIFSDLSASWFVLPGNHDRPAVRSGLFDAAFRARLVPDFIQHGSLAIAGLREHVPALDDNTDGYRMGARRATALLEQLEHARPEVLLLFSHIPFLDESGWAARHAGKPAGCFSHGEAFLARVAHLVERHAAAFCGHQHWHHIATGATWTHCSTAALIEYPLEVRIVTLEARQLRIETLPTVSEKLARASLNGAAWVRGRAEDRRAAVLLHGDDDDEQP